EADELQEQEAEAEHASDVRHGHDEPSLGRLGFLVELLLAHARSHSPSLLTLATRRLPWSGSWATTRTVSGRRSGTAPQRPHVFMPTPTSTVQVVQHTARSEEHTSELQSRENLVCRLLLEKKKKE